MRDLSKKLEKIEKKFGYDEVEPITFKAVKIIEPVLKAKAPRGPTGNLKRAVVVKKMPKSDQFSPTSIVAIDRKIAPHAGLVEFGSSRNSGKPYFRPAWDVTKGPVLALVTSEFKRLVKGAGK